MISLIVVAKMRLTCIDATHKTIFLAAGSQITLSELGFIGFIRFIGFEEQDWLNLFYSVKTSFSSVAKLRINCVRAYNT